MKGHECLQKLQGTKGTEVDKDVRARLGTSTSSSETSVETVKHSCSTPKKDALPKGNLLFQRHFRRVLKFSTEQDDLLKKGITKHGFGQWTAILRDPNFKFHERRTTDPLKKRAGLKFL